MATIQPFRIISADSNVMEPYDLWWNALGRRFGDRTPRIINQYRGEEGTFFYAGNPSQEAKITECSKYHQVDGAIGQDKH